MSIEIIDEVGFSVDDVIKLISSFIENRKSKSDEFNYGLESHGVFGITLGINLPYPIHVKQIGVRKSNKSKLKLKIEKHTPLF